RGEAAFDHTQLEQFRLLQREEGLDRFVIDGWFTLLRLLEGVQPGDILEVCYTITSHPRLLPERCACFFSLPIGLAVGHFRFGVRFRDSRPLQWKSSSSQLQPEETRDRDERIWTWSGDDFACAEREANTPDWHLSENWVQISDCADWEAVAVAVGAALARPSN